MFANSRIQAWLLALLCVTLLIGRIGGAHLHLCFDGKEPPSTLHLFDHGVHHGSSELNAPHDDADVALAGDMLLKSPFDRIWPLALLFVAVLLLRLPTRRGSFIPLTSAIRLPPSPFVRPPLRGPPLPFSR